MPNPNRPRSSLPILHPTAAIRSFTSEPVVSDAMREPVFGLSWGSPGLMRSIEDASLMEALLKALDAYGVTRVTVDYAGYGDSGDIESLSLVSGETVLPDLEHQKVELSYLQVGRQTWDVVAGAWPTGAVPGQIRVGYRSGRYNALPKPTPEDAWRSFQLGSLDTSVFSLTITSHQLERVTSTQTIGAFLHDLTLSALSQEHGGWEINEGSDGELVIDVASRTVELNHNSRFISCESFESAWTPDALLEQAESAALQRAEVPA